MIFQSICNGTLFPIEEVNDVVFSEKFMGDGVAFKLADENICAPFSGKITNMYHTNHALVIESEDNFEVLIHFGLGSFQIPFGTIKAFVKENDEIKAGQLLIQVDLKYFKRMNIDPVVPVVFLSKQKVNKKWVPKQVKCREILEGLVNNG